MSHPATDPYKGTFASTSGNFTAQLDGNPVSLETSPAGDGSYTVTIAAAELSEGTLTIKTDGNVVATVTITI